MCPCWSRRRRRRTLSESHEKQSRLPAHTLRTIDRVTPLLLQITLSTKSSHGISRYFGEQMVHCAMVVRKITATSSMFICFCFRLSVSAFGFDFWNGNDDLKMCLENECVWQDDRDKNDEDEDNLRLGGVAQSRAYFRSLSLSKTSAKSGSFEKCQELWRCSKRHVKNGHRRVIMKSLRVKTSHFGDFIVIHLILVLGTNCWNSKIWNCFLPVQLSVFNQKISKKLIILKSWMQAEYLR